MKTLSEDYAIARLKGFGKDYIILANGTILSRNRGRIAPLSTQITNSGYELIHLVGENGKRKANTVHRLVAITFIPNPDSKKFVNHKDGNKKNNRASNLEWVTHIENLKHAYNTGLLSHKGEKNSRSKLKDADVRIIRDRIINGDLLKDIAKDYGVDGSIISLVKHNKIWAHVK